MVVRIPTERITDWDSFHTVFAETLGFPSFYGRNLDAWIDCMSYLDDPNAGMTSSHVARGQIVTLHLEEATEFAQRCPEPYAALVECSAFVNWRRVDRGLPPILALSFYRNV
jgi:hypothetical protein